MSLFRNGFALSMIGLLAAVVISCGGGGGGGDNGTVDNASRTEAAALFYNDYAPAFSTASDWTGSTSTCSSGSASVAFRADVLMVINYFRAMAGLPGDVTLDSTLDAKAQDAALMMEANSRFSHYWGANEGDTTGTCDPVNNAWSCYTQDGCTAAKSSNLYYHSSQVVAGEVVDLLMEDSGQATLGHRRWFLYPRQDAMGVGAADRYAAIWVLGPWGTRPATPEWIAWPPAGYVPYQVVYSTWSFSGASPASFSGATVTVTKGGVNVPVTATELPLNYGDPGISWEFDSAPVFGPGMPDTAYTVTVSGITGMDQSSYSYGVTVFDPASAGP